MREKFPAWDDDAYLDFSRTGKRPRGEAMLRARSGRLYPLVMAECLEGRGRFLPAIQTALHEYVSQPTWTLPAHDHDLNCFHRKSYSVDLGSSMFAVELAQTLYLLGDKLPPSTRRKCGRPGDPHLRPRAEFAANQQGKLVDARHEQLERRLLGGVVGAAQCVLDDRRQRAEFLAAGEHYSRYYLSGFGNDGYCVEGIGYWDYGFSYFIFLREELLHSTGGQIDLFSDPKIHNVALFGSRIEICDGVYPAFGDCHFGSRPSASILAYCDHTLGLGLKTPKLSFPVWRHHRGLHDGLSRPRRQARESQRRARRRSACDRGFPTPGSWSAAPAAGSGTRLGICIKAGGNGSHSHNDAGSLRHRPGRRATGRRSRRSAMSTSATPSAPIATSTNCSIPSGIPFPSWPGSFRSTPPRFTPRSCRIISPMRRTRLPST